MIRGKTESMDAMDIQDREIEIRTLHQGDVDEVLRIEQACFSQPWTRSNFLDHLQYRPISQGWVAEHQEDIVGFLVAWYIAVYLEQTGEVHILNIAVIPEMQRHGIGYQLLLQAVDHGLDHRCDTAALEVRESNRAALSFYRNCGFSVVGRRRGYYGNEDALLMEASLPEVYDAISERV